MVVWVESSGLEITVEEPPLGSGGEATVHAITGQADLVAKVYRKPTDEHADKVAAMIAAPPADLTAKKHVSIAWPTSRLLSADADRRFLGYLMPRVHDTRLLYEIFNPRSRQQVAPTFHFAHLLRVARNLSAAMRALHERGYVIGDVNESNILVTRGALVTLIDTDSFQVRSGAQVYRCRVGKPEYTPPELQRARFAEVDRTPEHDNFGLAVLIFQLLMQGTHPFTGVYTGPGEPGAVPRWIEAGFFPYSRKGDQPVKPRPHAPPWKVIPPVIQELLRLCFEDGHRQPAVRPNATDWLTGLDLAEKELTSCEANPQHHYPSVLTDGCPWCEMGLLQGRDPFPTLEELRIKAAKTEPPAVIPLPQAIPVGLPAGPPRGRTVRIGRSAGKTVRRDVATAMGVVAPPGPLPSTAPREAVALQKATRRRQRVPLIVLSLGGVSAVVLIGALVAFLFVHHGDRLRSPTTAVIPTTPESVPADERFPWQPKELVTILGEHRGRHWSYAQSVAYTPDGKLFTGGVNGELYQWDPATLNLRSIFPGTGAGVPGLASSPDGSMLAAAARPDARVVAVFDVETRTEKYTFPGEDSGGNSVAFSSDGKTLAVAGGASRKVNLWDLGKREAVALMGHRGSVSCVAFSSDGKLLASGGFGSATDPPEVKLWDAATWAGKGRLLGPGGGAGFQAVAFSPKGDLLATVSDRVQLWEVPAGKEILIDGLTGASGRALAFSTDGKTVVWENNHEVAVVDVPNRTCRGHFIAPDLPPYGTLSLAYSPDGKTLAVATGPTLRLFDAATGTERVPLKGQTDAILALAAAEDGRTVVTGCADGSAAVWDVETAKELFGRGKRKSAIVALARTDGGREVVLAGKNGSVWRWKVRSGEEDHVIVPVGEATLALAPTGTRIALAQDTADARGVRLHNLADGKEAKISFTRRDGIECAAFTPGGEILAVGYQADVPNAVSSESRVLLWVANRPNRALFLNGLNTGISAVALSSDGKRLAVGGTGGKLKLADTATRQERANLDGHTRKINALAFAPVGSTLASADDEGRVILWDTTMPAKLREWKLPGPVPSVVFGSDGKTLYLGNGNGTVYILRLPAAK